MALLALDEGDVDTARACLEQGRARLPQMEHGLWHHQQLCEALRAQVAGELPEARLLFLAVLDGQVNLAARRRAVALGGLILMTQDLAERSSLTESLEALAADNGTAASVADVVLGPGDDRAPYGRPETMVRILAGWAAHGA